MLAFCQSYQSLSTICRERCQKIEPFTPISLTPWCIINKGSMDASELHLQCLSATYHSETTWRQVGNQDERLKGKCLGDRYMGSMSGQDHNV